MHHSLWTTLIIGLSIGPIRIATCFRVIDARISYHATQEALGQHKVVPPPSMSSSHLERQVSACLMLLSVH